MLNLPDIKEERKKAAELIRECLYGGLIVREALKQWPKINFDPTLICARHALIHYEADEDLQKKDREYIDNQIEWLEYLIKTLSEGQTLPQNIIESYEEYYEMPGKAKFITQNVIYIIMRIINKYLIAIKKAFKLL